MMARRRALGYLAALGSAPVTVGSRSFASHTPINAYDENQVDPVDPTAVTDLGPPTTDDLCELINAYDARRVRTTIDNLEPDIWAWRSVQPWAKSFYQRRREDRDVGPIRAMLRKRKVLG